MDGGHRREAAVRGGVCVLAEQVGVGVGQADGSDLALDDLLVQRTERLVDGHVRVGAVQLEEVDPVRAESAERGVDGLPDAAGMSAGDALVVGGVPELGGDDDVVAPSAECGAEVRLGGPAAVDVGGVEEVDAGVEGCVHDGGRVALVEPAAEVVAAEPDRGDVEVGDRSA